MTIRLATHARGIAVEAPGGALRNPELIRLAHTLAGRALLSGDRLIAPLETAGDIYAALGNTACHWDDDLLRHAVSQHEQRSMQLRARLEVASAIECPLSVVSDYPQLARLDPHQVEAVAALTTPSLQGLALFDEQGTGKTIATLAAFEILKTRQIVQRLLVVAPKSVLGSWQDQATAFLGESIQVSLAAGGSQSRRRAILRQHDILLIGYESAVHEEALLRTVVGARRGFYMLVIDESFFVKNRDTARARAVAGLRPLCERAVVLCGTPAPNSPIDVVNQIDIADGGVAFGGRQVRPGSPDEAQQINEGLRNAIILRRLKQDVLPELSAKETVKAYVSLTGVQRHLYDQARSELIVAVRSVDDREFTRQLTSFLARRTRLLQICSNPAGFDPLYDEVPAKLKALDHLLRELIDTQGKKVVIWSYFKASVEAIAKRYARYGLVRIDGSVSSVEDRISSVNRFQGDKDVRIFLGNAAAAGAGITLTAAHHAIYESLSNQAAHYMQSLDRIHRRGQQEQVVSHILIARETVEELEFARLVHKEHVGRQLLGDDYVHTLTRERFLAEL